MSQENVEIIRRGYEHFKATGGEIRAHPDLVWDVSNLGWPDQQIYTGPRGRNADSTPSGPMHGMTGSWSPRMTSTPASVSSSSSPSGGVRRPPGSPSRCSFAQVWTLRDGQGIRMQLYGSVEEALEAVGLSE